MSQFAASGNFGDTVPGESVFGSTVPTSTAPKRNKFSGEEEGEVRKTFSLFFFSF